MKNKTETIKLTKDILPSHATHVGTLISDEIEYRNIKQKELAMAMNIAPSVLNEIIHGKRNLTAELAIKLEKALDIDAAYWMRLQVRYEIDTIRIKHREEIMNNTLSKKEQSKFSKKVFHRANA